MFTVFVKYQENSAILKLPCSVRKIREVFSSIGYAGKISEIPVLTDENAELTVRTPHNAGQRSLDSAWLRRRFAGMD